MTSALRDDSIPLYKRVKNWISERIDSGEWAPGDRILSENELVRRFGVSRMTVHRSLRELVMEQRLKRVPGVGTFVAERRIPAPLLELKSISEEIQSRGTVNIGIYSLVVGKKTAFSTLDRSEATRSVMSEAFLDLGVAAVTGGLPVYLSFTRELLLDGVERRESGTDLQAPWVESLLAERVPADEARYWLIVLRATQDGTIGVVETWPDNPTINDHVREHLTALLSERLAAEEPPNSTRAALIS
jgi:DNA-binding transcriptional regulator YhcF (GntR family)